jgi:hypothetical protein
VSGHEGPEPDNLADLGEQLPSAAALAVAAQLAERNELIRAQVVATTSLTAEVLALRSELDTRPTRSEVGATRARQSARTVAALVAFMLVTAYLAIFLHEEYRDRCSVEPARAAAPAPGWCPYIFPIHTMEMP